MSEEGLTTAEKYENVKEILANAEKDKKANAKEEELLDDDYEADETE